MPVCVNENSRSKNPINGPNLNSLKFFTKFTCNMLIKLKAFSIYERFVIQKVDPFVRDVLEGVVRNLQSSKQAL